MFVYRGQKSYPPNNLKIYGPLIFHDIDIEYDMDMAKSKKNRDLCKRADGN